MQADAECFGHEPSPRLEPGPYLRETGDERFAQPRVGQGDPVPKPPPPRRRSPVVRGRVRLPPGAVAM